jgi:hypothetical protein
VSVHGLVWRDLNADGQQNTGEPGRAGVTVELRTPGGILATSTTTASDGTYTLAPEAGLVRGGRGPGDRVQVLPTGSGDRFRR